MGSVKAQLDAQIRKSLGLNYNSSTKSFNDIAGIFVQCTKKKKNSEAIRFWILGYSSSHILLFYTIFFFLLFLYLLLYTVQYVLCLDQSKLKPFLSFGIWTRRPDMLDFILLSIINKMKEMYRDVKMTLTRRKEYVPNIGDHQSRLSSLPLVIQPNTLSHFSCPTMLPFFSLQSKQLLLLLTNI